jgi:hypothetical protein
MRPTARRALISGLVGLVAVGIAVPSEAAPKKKPKPIKGSYALTLLPDPSGQSAAVLGGGCTGVIPMGQDKHEFTVPARGTLQVVVDSPDPTGAGVTDWDLYLLGADGSVLSQGTSQFSHEEAAAKFKKKEKVTFWVCNLIGQPSGTVSYTFTYA